MALELAALYGHTAFTNLSQCKKREFGLTNSLQSFIACCVVVLCTSLLPDAPHISMSDSIRPDVTRGFSRICLEFAVFTH